MGSEDWQRWCVVVSVCNEFESLDQWADSGFYCGVVHGSNNISSTNLILNTCHFLSEDPHRQESPTDTKLKSARLDLFYKAGMAGVFTNDFVDSMVEKTRELTEEHQKRRGGK
jgi:hypothetical protein